MSRKQAVKQQVTQKKRARARAVISASEHSLASDLLPGYVFRDTSLLIQALSHRSMGRANNERLEFLGDSLLGLIITEAVYNSFPEADEGQLSRLRSQLVCRASLARIARDMNLGPHVQLGPGESKTGAWQRDKILADTLEALIAAVYLDGDFAACRACILTLFRPLLETMTPEAPKDAKTRLQEHLHAQGTSLPVYTLLQALGPDHARCFEVVCEVPGVRQQFIAQGTSRRQAEQASAALALEHLQCP